MSYLLALYLFFTAYDNPLSDSGLASGVRPASEVVALYEGLGVSSGLLYAVVLMGSALFAVRAWQLPFGSLCLLLCVSTLLAAFPHEAWKFLPAALTTGLVPEGLLLWCNPSPLRPFSFRLFALLVPLVLYALYFAALALTDAIWWRVHLWAGTPLLAGGSPSC